MKAPIKYFLPLVLVGMSATLLKAGDWRKKAPGAKDVITARPTHGEIEKKRLQKTTDSKIELVDKPIKIEEIRSGKTDSLINRSTILSYGAHWTLVPKEAVLHVPSHLSQRVGAERKGKLITWKEFFAKNRGWIRPQSVSLVQARGEAPLAEDVLTSIQSSGWVVVAVCHDGPISVKKPKDEKPGKLVPTKGQVKPGVAKTSR